MKIIAIPVLSYPIPMVPDDTKSKPILRNSNNTQACNFQDTLQNQRYLQGLGNIQRALILLKTKDTINLT